MRKTLNKGNKYQEEMDGNLLLEKIRHLGKQNFI